jgi:hypothetical protein
LSHVDDAPGPSPQAAPPPSRRSPRWSIKPSAPASPTPSARSTPAMARSIAGTKSARPSISCRQAACSQSRARKSAH